MNPAKNYLIKEGKITSLYEDGSSPSILEKLGGEAEIRRASHVEASEGKLKNIEFNVDLSPSKGPTISGFSSYKEAVSAEIHWINQNVLNK